MGVSAMALAANYTTRIYPYILAIFASTVILLALFTIIGHHPWFPALTTIGVAISYRLLVMSQPATVVGNDLPENAAWIDGVVSSGSTDAIGSSFYAAAPLHYLYGAQLSLLADLPAEAALMVYAFALPLVLAPVSIVIAQQLGLRNTRYLALVAILAVITTEGVRRSYMPISQSHANIYWWIFIPILIKYVRSPSRQMFGLLSVTFIILAFTHKLPLLIASITLIAFLSISHFGRLINVVDDEEIFKTRTVFLFSLIAVVMFAQWVFAPVLLEQIMRRISEFIISLTEPADTTTFAGPFAAEPARPGILGTIWEYPTGLGLFIERGHIFWLLLAGGVSWLYLCIRNLRTEWQPASLIVLSATAICVAMLSVGFVAVSAMNPTRPLVMIEPLLVAMIVVTLFALISKLQSRGIGGRQLVLSGAIVLLVLSQVFAASIAADYANTPRYYLDAPEANAQQTLCNASDEEIHTDQTFSQMSYINQENCDQLTRISRSAEDPLYNANITPDEHEMVAIRNNVDVYLGLEDRWVLTWDPEETLATDYHTIYNNDGVTAFNSPD